MTDLPPIDRRKLLDYLQHVKKDHIAGSRGKLMENYCKGQRDAAYTLIAEVVTGTLEVDP